MVKNEEKEASPSCRLIWEGGQPIVECDSPEDVVKATAVITEMGVLIRGIKVKK